MENSLDFVWDWHSNWGIEPAELPPEAHTKGSWLPGTERWKVLCSSAATRVSWLMMINILGAISDFALFWILFYCSLTKPEVCWIAFVDVAQQEWAIFFFSTTITSVSNKLALWPALPVTQFWALICLLMLNLSNLLCQVREKEERWPIADIIT